MAVEKRRQSESIYQRIRSDILTSAIRPSSDLDEQSLAQVYGTSRTPVREALIKLAADGLVKFGAKRGVRVTPLILPDLPRYLEALSFHHRGACHLAALRRHDIEMGYIEAAYESFVNVGLDESVGTDNLSAQVADCEMKFYIQVSNAGHNSYLTDEFNKLLTAGLRMMRLPFAYVPRGGQTVQGYLTSIFQEQKDLVKAIEQQNPGLAEKCAVNLHKLRILRLREFNEENLLADVSIMLDDA